MTTSRSAKFEAQAPFGSHGAGHGGPASLPGLRGLASPARLCLLLLVAGTLGLAVAHIGLLRPLFILGAAGVGYMAWREGPARVIECAIYLFAITPFLRRMADYGLGYDESGIMLVGPLLAICVPVLDLRELLHRRSPAEATFTPVILMIACLTYALMISALDGTLAQAGITFVKRLAPLLFGLWVMSRVQETEGILAAAARSFLIVTPLMGVYGVLQYLNPQPWDGYWMVLSKMDSIGTPEPMQVRVFSTMNSPGSYATFAACGLLLFGFCRRDWKSALFALPAIVGLLLTLYRTAWISLAVGILYCACFSRTRGRAGLIVLVLGVAVVLAASASEFGDLIVNRLATMGSSVSDDGSGRARLDQFVQFYEELDELLLGHGLAVSRPGARVLDGEVATAIVEMGLIAGPLYLMSIVWAGVQALSRIGRDAGAMRIVVGAGVAGILAQMPLAGISAGETGFLFWMLVGLATAGGTAGGRDQAGG